MRRVRGFTLVELVAVMLIAAILAVFAAGALDTRSFDIASFTEEVNAQVAYAQKIAVAARRPVTVTVAGNAISLTRCRDINCAASDPVSSIRGNASLQPKAGSGITINAAPANVFAFDALGNTAATTTITLTGSAVRTVTIERGTGYVYVN